MDTQVAEANLNCSGVCSRVRKGHFRGWRHVELSESRALKKRYTVSTAKSSIQFVGQLGEIHGVRAPQTDLVLETCESLCTWR